MRLADIVSTSRSVARVTARGAKVEALAALLARTPPDDVEIAASYLSGNPAQGRIGLGYAALQEARDVAPAANASLELADVNAAFARIAAASGAGSAAARVQELRDLLARATADEQQFLIDLVAGELRQGALEGVLLEAVARAAHVPAALVRRAAMLAGALPPVARTALVEGESALARFVLRPLQPVQPMLAQSAPDVDSALADLGEALLEWKLDGARIQVHKSGDEVKVFSRTLRDVTAAVPEAVTLAHALPVRDAIFDGEVIALRADGSPHPFQTTMRRFGRSLDPDTLRHELPLTPFLFDALYLDGGALVDEPLGRRLARLDEVIPAANRVPRILTSSRDDAAAFVARALATGHEGVMAKATAATYAAGRRGAGWLKVKPARTLDLVVLAAEWGSGRRRGTLSNLHLGARDDQRGGFVMLGKTFKGLTDATLAWQTRRFLEIEIARDAHTVYVRPEVVVEIAFNDIQQSPQYPGHLALRFARVKRYREDKTAAEADTFATLQALYRQMTGLEPPPR